MMRRFSRRMFGSLLLSTLAVPAVQAAQRVWDVIVVGAGGAGLSAAVSAAEAGAKVLLLEKMPHIGGNTRISGGFYACVRDRVTPTPNLQPFWYTTPRLP